MPDASEWLQQLRYDPSSSSPVMPSRVGTAQPIGATMGSVLSLLDQNPGGMFTQPVDSRDSNPANSMTEQELSAKADALTQFLTSDYCDMVPGCQSGRLLP
jgi:hypothetical protein